MAGQTEERKVAGAKMLTLNATTIETSGIFSPRARAVTVVTSADAYIAFDTTATTGDPSILLLVGEELEIRDCDFTTFHAITAAGTATVRCAYSYVI